MLKQRRFLIEALTAAGLIVAPFILPHLGFAPNTGGPLAYLDRFGLRNAVNTLDDLTRELGNRYAVPALMRKMAETNETFFEKV